MSSSTHRMARTSASAASRSSTSSKKATGWLFIQRNSRTVSGLPCQGEDSGTCRVNVAPGDEAALGVVGVQLELERALESVRLDEAADAELRLARGNGVHGLAGVRARSRGVLA